MPCFSIELTGHTLHAHLQVDDQQLQHFTASIMQSLPAAGDRLKGMPEGGQISCAEALLQNVEPVLVSRLLEHALADTRHAATIRVSQ